MTARNTFARILLLLLLFSLCLGGCHDAPPPADGTTATTTTTTTVPTNDPPAAPRWASGEPLRPEDVTARFTLERSSIQENVVAYHGGKVLLEDGTDGTKVYSLYDPATATRTTLGEAPALRYGSGGDRFSTDGRYFYTAYIPMTDSALTLVRVDFEKQTVQTVDQLPHGVDMHILYAEGDLVWRLWRDDPESTRTPASYTTHMDCFNVATGERTALFKGQTIDRNHIGIADDTVYLLRNNAAVETYTLQGDPLDRYDLAFLQETLGGRMEFPQITVGGDFITLRSLYGAKYVVLQRTKDGLRLLRAFNDDVTRIFDHRTNGRGDSFGYLLCNGTSLFRYDEADNRFVEHAMPVDMNTHTFIDEDGNILFMRRDRTAIECFVYADIAW